MLVDNEHGDLIEDTAGAHVYLTGSGAEGMRSPIRGIVLFVLLAAISTAGVVYLLATAQPDPQDREATLDGIWLSRGYGWLWQIDGGEITRFDVGRGFCIPSQTDGMEEIGTDNRAKLSKDGLVLRLLREDPDYFYTFDRVPELPAVCNREPDISPAAVFDTAVEILGAHYAFFEERGVDWPDIVERARAGVHPAMDDAQLFSAFQVLLGPIGDSHLGLEAEIDGDDESIWGAGNHASAPPEAELVVPGAWNPRAAAALLGEAAVRKGDGLLRYGLFDGDVGYLEVRSMAGMGTRELDAALDDAMSTFEGAVAVIVDVSRNDGGYDSFARRIAQRFAAEPTVACSKSAGDFEGDQAQSIVLRPSDRPRYTGPVFLITSHDTLSAAEIFAMSMRALPNVTHLGETTDGSLSDELWKTLPNGWVLSLSNEVYLDSDGVLWEGRGIPAELWMSISDHRSITERDRQTVRAVFDFVRAQHD